MKEKCEFLEKCAFFAKYKDGHNVACLAFMHMYCLGDNKTDCARFQYKNEHSAPPPTDLLPNGKFESELDENDKGFWDL